MRKTFWKYLVAVLAVFMIFGAVTVSADDAANQAYWIDVASGAKIDQLVLSDGGTGFIRLVAEVPKEKILKAYSCIVMYDNAAISVDKASAAVGSSLPALNVNDDDSGSIVVNAFDVAGIDGEAEVAIVDVVVTANTADASFISVLFSAFGSSSDDQFMPDVKPLEVVVK